MKDELKDGLKRAKRHKLYLNTHAKHYNQQSHDMRVISAPTLAVSDGGEHQLGLGAEGGDHLLHLVSSLGLGPVVDDAGGFLGLCVGHTLNEPPKLHLNQVLVRWRHLEALGGEDSHTLLQVGDHVTLQDSSPQALKQICRQQD